MIALRPRRSITLAVHPTWAGFGWAAFEGPFAPFDWGLVYVDCDKNARCLRRLERLLDRLGPQTFVLEAYEPRASARADRIAKLCRAMVDLATKSGADVAVHTRGDVQACFAYVDARTRYDIAVAVSRTIEAFRHKLPRRRRAWEREDPRIALFSAAALALTSYSRSATRLLDELGGVT
ncbi:MAG: hypothetical protein ACREML_08725 [Vulcanimicrobiaceae bacterium]